MKKILFVCIENSCRSQIAEGFARKFGSSVIEAYSAGSKPKGEVNPDAIKVMLEEGIDISENKSKGFPDLKVKDFDYAVTLGCGDVCPFIPAKNHINWDISDPKGKPIEFFRTTRDEIMEKVKQLINDLTTKKVDEQ